MVPWLPVITALVIAGGAITFARLREQRQTEGLRDAAAALGLRFEGRGPSLRELPFGRLFRPRGPFRRGVRRSIRGRLDGIELWFFEYPEVRSTGKTTHVQQVPAVAFPLEGARIPVLHLRPERFMDRVIQNFGRSDIDFDNHPDFSRAYVVRGDEEDAVRRIFNPETVYFFERNRGWMVDAADGWLLVRRRRRVPSQELHEFLRNASRIRSLLVRS
jgi:hypothetical protein